jgi:hypothetical protein
MHFIFKKGSRFTAMFDDAIKINKHKINQITQKYTKYQAPSKCEKEGSGPMPLCELFFSELVDF